MEEGLPCPHLTRDYSLILVGGVSRRFTRCFVIGCLKFFCMFVYIIVQIDTEEEEKGDT